MEKMGMRSRYDGRGARDALRAHPTQSNLI
jgi:hypothetical protein